MKTFKIIGILLNYPSHLMQEHMVELVGAVKDEGLVSGREQKKLFSFMAELEGADLLEIQADYVATFDRSRGNSLYLFEHIHGEGRDRGQAMVDLIDHYRTKGLEIAEKELPDYLPLFLEFLSQCDQMEAQELLGEVVHIIAAIGAKLKMKGSGYQYVFKALASMTNAKVNDEFVKQALAEEATRDDSLEALDREWEDTPAFDGTGQADCGGCPATMAAKRIDDLNPNSIRH